MSDLLDQLIRDWLAEAQELEALLQQLTAEQWVQQTPATGWTVKHQVQHLSWTEHMYIRAMTDPEGFTQYVQEALVPGNTVVDDEAAAGLEKTGTELLQSWGASRAAMAELLVALPQGARIPWIATAMGAASAATARLMETFAHGQDIRDTFAVAVSPAARLKHVAHLAVRTMGFNFRSHGLEVPQEPILVELTFKDEVWSWGEADATQSVKGPALDFVLLAVRRRHLDDLSLVVQGEDAHQWLRMIQAFAGPAGEPRQPRVTLR